VTDTQIQFYVILSHILILQILLFIEIYLISEIKYVDLKFRGMDGIDNNEQLDRYHP